MNNSKHGCRKIEDKAFFERLINERGYKVIDVRPPLAYRDGTLMGAPNVALRNFLPEFMRVRKETNKIILIGSKDDPSDLEASLKYAITAPAVDEKMSNISYVYYEEMMGEENTRNKKRGR